MKCKSHLLVFLLWIFCSDFVFGSAVQSLTVSDNSDQCTRPEGTFYDEYIVHATQAYSMHCRPNEGDDFEDAALFVIDMQKDFVGVTQPDSHLGGPFHTGSFALPCSEKAQDFSQRVADLMVKFAQAGGLVVVSRDFHPQTHCSFAGQGLTSSAGLFKKSSSLGACQNKQRFDLIHTDNERYNNLFPSHCTFSQHPDGTLLPSEGSRLHPAIQEALDTIVDSAHALHAPVRLPRVVWKGFHHEYESFSAFSHVHVATPHKSKERTLTGAWQRQNDPTGKMPPTRYEIGNPRERMISTNTILRKHGIRRLFVVGLVFDYCVGETALFALKNSQARCQDATRCQDTQGMKNGLTDVTILTNFSRPTMDGLPGIISTLGTASYLQSVASLWQQAGICLQPSQQAWPNF